MTPKDLEALKAMDVLVVEWNDEGNEGYLRFLESLNKPLHKVVVDIPDIQKMLVHVILTGDLSEFYPYEKEKARLVLKYVEQHPDQVIGSVIGDGPWKFLQPLFEQHDIPYRFGFRH